MANKKRKRRPPSGRPPSGSAPAGGPPAARQPAKSERRQEERRQRAEAERKAAKVRRVRSILVRLGIGLVLGLIVYLGLQLARPKSSGAPPSFVPTTSPTVAPSGLPGILSGDAPWSANNDPTTLKARLDAIGLPALGTEGQVLHIHQHLDIYVSGRPVTVPAEIGISADQQFLSDLHTHDTSGIIHVESATKRTFTLGQFFDVWGVTFTPTCIGGYCTSGDATLETYVNGHKVSGDPGLVVLRSHDEIVVAYGTPSELPDPIPSSFTFPTGS